MRATRAPQLPGATGLHVVCCTNLAWCRRPTERIGHGARMLTAALLFLPLAATACPRTEALTETEAKAEATMQPVADTTPTIASPAESEAEEEEDATPEVLARVAARTAAAAAAVRAHRRRLRAHQLAVVAADKSLSRIGPAWTHVGPPLGISPRRPVATVWQSWR